MANHTNDYLRAFKASITRIYHSKGAVVGAGFLVSNQNILTCAHVITEALGIPENTQEIPTESINLDFPLIAPGDKLAASVVFWKPVSSIELVEDIAGLKLDSQLPIAAQPALLLTAEDLWEHSIRIFGFPKGHNDGVWASGVLRDKNAKGWLQIEDVKVPGYQVEPGFSGAPVWNEHLSGVVGMAVAAEKRRENVKAAFVIPTRVLSQTWADLERWGQISTTTTKPPLSSLTSGQRRRLERERNDLNVPYDLLSQKLQRLRKAHTLETDVNVKFKLELQIEETQGELDKFESRLDEIEQQLT